MLSVLTSSTQDVLAQLADLKSQLLGTATSTANDDVYEFFLSVASERIMDEVGYYLLKQSYRERVKSYGLNEIAVTRKPLLSIDSIWNGTDSGSVVDASEYFIEDADAGVIQRSYPWAWNVGSFQRLNAEPIRGQERNNYTINFDAGYVYPGTTDGTTDEYRTLPYAIEQATLQCAKFLIKLQSRDESITMRKVGELQVEYSSNQQTNARIELPDSILTLLQPYRSII